MAKYWKIRKGVWGYVTPSGRRGIAKSETEAKRLVGESRKNKKSNKNPKRRRFSLPRRRRPRRRYGFGVRSIFKIVRWGSLAAPAAVVAMDSSLDWHGKINRIVSWYTGYSPAEQKFRWEDLKRGWLPYVVVSLFTTFIQKINGIIRRL